MSADALMAEFRLLAGRGTRVNGADAMNVFLRLHPHLEVEHARSAFIQQLREREPAELRLPRGSDHWDAASRPPVPKWFLLVRAKPPRSATFDHRSHLWASPLRFLASLPVWRGVNDAVIVDRWLRAMKEDEPFVPIKERSWEIFGEEKKLDRMMEGPLFSPGGLTLQDLRCYTVPHIPVHRIFPAAVARLVISENEAGFDSLCRAGAELAAFRCVVYGHGSAAEKSAAFVAQVVAEHHIEECLYVGDVDRKGLFIAENFARRLAAEHKLILRPWVSAYRAMLVGEATPVPGGSNVDAETAWLPADLNSAAQALIRSGERRAQEAVGWKAIRRIFAEDPRFG